MPVTKKERPYKKLVDLEFKKNKPKRHDGSTLGDPDPMYKSLGFFSLSKMIKKTMKQRKPSLIVHMHDVDHMTSMNR